MGSEMDIILSIVDDKDVVPTIMMGNSVGTTPVLSAG